MVTLKHFVFASLAASLWLACNREARPGGVGGGDSASTNERATIASLKRQLDEVSDRITALGEKAEQAGSKVHQAARDDIERLEKARDDLYMRLGALQTAGADRWQELKTSAGKSVDSLSQAADRAWKNVTGEERAASADE